MKVIEIGNIATVDGEGMVGIVIEATRDELREIAGNVIFKEVEIVVKEGGSEND